MMETVQLYVTPFSTNLHQVCKIETLFERESLSLLQAIFEKKITRYEDWHGFLNRNLIYSKMAPMKVVCIF